MSFDFDAWRDSYDTLTFDDQKGVYEDIARLFPCQQSFNIDAAREFIGLYEPRTVVELGGWDGALANHFDDLVSWRNYDLVAVPQVCAKPWYQLCVLEWPFAQYLHVADVFIAMHTIEHFRAAELEQIVPRLCVKACLIEAPLDEAPTDWAGYFGTHILETGWTGVDSIFASAGFIVRHEWPSGRFYER